MIELEAGDPLAIGQTRRCGERTKLAAVDEGFHDVLLDVQVGVDDGTLRPKMVVIFVGWPIVRLASSNR